MITNFLNGMFGKIGDGMCKLSMTGDIAIKTKNGYKTFDVSTNKLTNCSSFVFDTGSFDCFFVIPTNKVEKGDIIISSGLPKCVINVSDDNSIECLNYETNAIEKIIPENHMFMGNTYFYGKIVSMLGNNLKKKNGTKKIFKYMMMSEMMKNMSGNNDNNAMSNMMPMFMLMNSENTFEDMFDFMPEEEE